MPFTDNFTGSNGDDLDGRTGWTRVDGTAGAAEVNASNQLKCSTSDSAGALYTVECGTADHYAQHVAKTVTWSLSVPFGSVVRGVDRSNFIGARTASVLGGADLYKKVSGSFSLVGSYSYTAAVNDAIKLEISGTSVTCYVNGVSRITSTVSDSVFSGVTKAGLVARAEVKDPWLDDFECTQSAGGGIVGPLIGGRHLIGGPLIGGRLAA